ADPRADAAGLADPSRRHADRRRLPDRHIERPERPLRPATGHRFLQRLCRGNLRPRRRAGGPLRSGEAVCPRAENLRRRHAILRLALPALFPRPRRGPGDDALLAVTARLAGRDTLSLSAGDTGRAYRSRTGEGWRRANFLR